MPDTMMSQLREARSPKHELITEERANRLHALLIAVISLDEAGLNLSDEEETNVRHNLLHMARAESAALLATM